MALPLSVMLTRYVCNFNAISLILLAFQNAGYLVLMGYAQQLQDSPPLVGDSPRGKLTPSHFVATTEFTKLVLSLMWCMYDVLQEMRKEEQDAHRDGDSSAHDDASARPESAVDPNSSKHDIAAPFGTPSKSHPHAEVSLRRILSRPNFTAQFGVRLRHAIGFDEKYKEALLMVVPAVLYTIQGLLLILALQYLDPTVFQILYQVRIMFLAVMMRAALDFKLSPVRWVALVALMVGIILAQLAMQRAEAARSEEVDNTATTHKSWTVEGTIAALIGAALSSCSGVFMEFVFKKRGNFFTLSARNIHLAFFSLVYFCLVFLSNILKSGESGSFIDHVGDFLSGFFEGFTGLVWFLVLLQAVGGILVALVMRYCDNIVKSFSTAFAIVLSGTASVFLFSLPLDPLFLFGSVLVMGSITVYSLKK